MSQHTPNFKNKDDENKFLTLSEIFIDVKPEQIIDKLNEAHGDVQGAIEKILSAKGGSTPRPERANSASKPESTPSDAEKTKKTQEDLGMVQKTLEEIYEKSFELLETKIKEQSVEIENLLTHLKTTKEQISLRDTELGRYKTEIENLKTQMLEANSNPVVQPASCKCQDILTTSVQTTQKAMDAGLVGLNNFQAKSQENALNEFNMKFKLSMGFSFLREALEMEMSKEMLEQFMMMKLAFDQSFHARSEEANRRFDEEKVNNPENGPLYPQLGDANQPQQQQHRLPPMQMPGPMHYPRPVQLPGLKQPPPQSVPMVIPIMSGSTNPFNNQRIQQGPGGPIYSAPHPHPASQQYYYYSAPPQNQAGPGYLHPVPPLVKQQSYPGSLHSSQNLQ